MDKSEVIMLPVEALPRVDELTGDLRMLAEVVGVAMALEIGQVFQDTPIRLYSVKKFIRRYRDDRIRGEYDAGFAAVRLARKYRLSERHIWNILGTAPEVANGPAQMDLFG